MVLTRHVSNSISTLLYSEDAGRHPLWLL